MTTPLAHLGYWINWKNSRFLGGTLTITEGGSVVLAVFAALFVTQVGNSLWTLMNYVIHESQAAHQAQVSRVQYYLLKPIPEANSPRPSYTFNSWLPGEMQLVRQLACGSIFNCAGGGDFYHLVGL